MWTYQYNAENKNVVQVFDLTHLKKHQLNIINWNLDDAELNFQLNNLLLDVRIVKLDNSRGDIRSTIPLINKKVNLLRKQDMIIAQQKERKIIRNWLVVFQCNLKKDIINFYGNAVTLKENLMAVRF